MSLPVVSVERSIDAPAQQVFDVLADPSMHPVIDGSGSVRKITSDEPRLRLGSSFGAQMKIGVGYRVTNTVVEFEEGRRLAWRHFGGHRWRYVLTPVGTGTLVREEWDASRLPAPVQLAFKVLGVPARNRKGMETTLERLEQQLAR